MGFLDENDILEADFFGDYMMVLAENTNFGDDLYTQIRYLRERVVIPFMQEQALT
jgi:hypothetical protein